MYSDCSSDIHSQISHFSGHDDFPTIQQYAGDVLDYSSSYGSHGTLSYSALNICGRPCKYPSYGDFAECFSLRHYGPMVENEYSIQDVQDKITFHDYIVIQFEHYVLPREITIYETYNPGSVVRIYAYLWGEKKWEMLWEDHPVMVEKKSREFCPRLRKIQTPTRVLRLEFNCSLVDYYIGIDAVMLGGIKPPCPISRQPPESKIIMGIIQKKLENAKFIPQVPASDAIEDFLKNDLNKFIENLQIKEPDKAIKRGREVNNLTDIPDEVLFNILSYLDIRSLFNCSLVCRKFNRIAKDPLLYLEVNLKLYWYLANTQLIQTLQNRCKMIKKMDLSSCGYNETIRADDFINFIRLHGLSLTHLRLNSAHFINGVCIQTIAFRCDNLVELQLQNYQSPTNQRDFNCLTLLCNLEYVNISRTNVDTYGVVSIIKCNPKLQYLNISFNQQLAIDQICFHLATYSRHIKTLDIWKCHHLSTSGLRHLKSCDTLEVVDFGWNLREESNITEHFKNLIESCTNMKKMVLAAVRGICERDMNNIATYGKKLEHLDLMGIVGITSEAVLKVLKECPHLKVIDLSFCANLDDITLFRWANEYNVNIKRSEAPSEF